MPIWCQVFGLNIRDNKMAHVNPAGNRDHSELRKTSIHKAASSEMGSVGMDPCQWTQYVLGAARSNTGFCLQSLERIHKGCDV